MRRHRHRQRRQMPAPRRRRWRRYARRVSPDAPPLDDARRLSAAAACRRPRKCSSCFATGVRPSCTPPRQSRHRPRSTVAPPGGRYLLKRQRLSGMATPLRDATSSTEASPAQPERLPVLSRTPSHRRGWAFRHQVWEGNKPRPRRRRPHAASLFTRRMPFAAANPRVVSRQNRRESHSANLEVAVAGQSAAAAFAPSVSCRQ